MVNPILIRLAISMGLPFLMNKPLKFAIGELRFKLLGHQGTLGFVFSFHRCSIGKIPPRNTGHGRHTEPETVKMTHDLGLNLLPVRQRKEL